MKNDQREKRLKIIIWRKTEANPNQIILENYLFFYLQSF